VGVDADAPAPLALSPYWSEREKREVSAGCYQLLLALADAEGRQDARKAIAILDMAAKLFQPTQALHLRRAHLLQRIHDEAGARRERAAALSLSPRSAIDYFLLGDWYFQHGKLAEAADKFQQAFQMEPADFWSQYYLAVCLLDLKRPAEAAAGLTKCLERKADFSRAYLLRGRAYAELNQAEAADRDFTAALKLEAGGGARYILLVSRGRLRLARNQVEPARADLEEAIALRPDYFHALFNLALLYQAQQEFAKSNDVLDQALRLQPRKEIAVECHVERSRNFYLAKQYGPAVEAAETALAIMPTSADAELRRAFALLELKRYQSAKESFTFYLDKIGKPSGDFYRGRGQAHMQLGEYLNAKDDYTRALDLNPQADLFAHRGWAYYFADSWKPALRDFEEAVRRAPDNADGYVGRGLARLMLGQIHTAIADAETALSRRLRTPEMMHNTACIFALAAGHPDKVAAETVSACRDQALKTIQKTLDMVPAAERPEFWRTKIQPDPALASLRNTAAFMDWQRQYAPKDVKKKR
jgi:tetratricopeptide (TPR) repeat protein